MSYSPQSSSNPSCRPESESLAAAPARSVKLSVVAAGERPRVHGKFIFIGDEKLYIRGVTYGTFRPAANGSEYGDPVTVERDFAQMTANEVNAIRTYTVPPRWLLDIAHRQGLRLMIGLPWEQHVAFLDKKRARSI